MEINNASFVTSMVKYGKFTGIGLPQIAVMGKSNVGKSSLINALCRHKKLCKTSSTPGKTRLINVFLINCEHNGKKFSFHLIDLPGYGFAKVNKTEKMRWGQMMDSYFQNSQELMHVLHLVDIRHDPTKDDITMNNYLRTMGLEFTVVATKSDKISRAARMKHIAPICRILIVQPWEVVCFSSLQKAGREDVFKKILPYLIKLPKSGNTNIE